MPGWDRISSWGAGAPGALGAAALALLLPAVAVVGTSGIGDRSLPLIPSPKLNGTAAIAPQAALGTAPASASEGSGVVPSPLSPIPTAAAASISIAAEVAHRLGPSLSEAPARDRGRAGSARRGDRRGGTPRSEEGSGPDGSLPGGLGPLSDRGGSQPLPPIGAAPLAGQPATPHSQPGGSGAPGASPPGLAKKGGTPPGLAKKGGTPPGLAKKGGAPPGLAR